MQALVDGTLVQLSSTRSSGACPDCGIASLRVHSRYGRQLYDCPVVGRPVLVHLTVRRIFCDTPTCPRTTSVEQIGGVHEPCQRASSGLCFVLRSTERRPQRAQSDRPPVRCSRANGLRISSPTNSWCWP
ncbi:transposase family protein [Streptomyces violaceusniger]|uniref:transposase family protein n=1 Tax=Streptomyces violaceusniger TaxID=68280 RepID=UPI0031CE231A